MEGRKALFVHIEGLDLAGKTSVANELIKIHPFIYQHNLISSTFNRLKEIGDIVDSMSESGKYDDYTISMGYAAVILADRDEFFWPKEDTVQDSASIVRAITHTEISNKIDLSSILKVALFDDRFPKFTKSFYLTSSVDERIKRLTNCKDASKNDQILLEDKEKFYLMDEIAKELSQKVFNSKIIDTTGKNPEDVALIIKEDLCLKQNR